MHEVYQLIYNEIVVRNIFIITFLLVVLGGGGFFLYRNYFGTKTSTTSNPGQNSTQLCDLQKQTCTSVNPSFGSGAVNVTVKARENPINELEVDLGTKPGASEYYLSRTNSKGVALFEGIPAGSYVIYFNQNNFPSGFSAPAPEQIQVVKGESKEITIKIL